VGATVVVMADGSSKPIEDVVVGDLVTASDAETGVQGTRLVEQVFVHEDTVVDLVVGGEVISTTEDHPFWSATHGQFERADELQAGELVLTAAGSVLAVEGIRAGTERTALAYNLAVEGIHTYHVGHAQVLVHNTCPVVSGVVGLPIVQSLSNRFVTAPTSKPCILSHQKLRNLESAQRMLRRCSGGRKSLAGKATTFKFIQECRATAVQFPISVLEMSVISLGMGCDSEEIRFR